MAMNKKQVVTRMIATIFLSTMILGLTAFAQNAKPTYAVLIDNTGSLRTQFPYVVALSDAIIKRTCQRGSISLFNFKTSRDERGPVAVVTSGPQSAQELRLLEQYLTELFVVPGQTSLKDAISSIARQLNSRTNQMRGEEIIILITDGEDRVSKTKEDELLKDLKSSGTKVYAVGLTSELENADSLLQKSKRQKSAAFLKKLTSQTGGRVVFASSKNDIDSVLDTLLAE